ncbi:MAG: AbrB/MazE/SpoVT family DNA-binding domain-containing protein [Bifidobacteriaceae bacterium]|jgi:AbrB family looped-hinge helix DNA binding protein|nr:AbrB/MazE/SpoVT family DNA-binding domain-containing protein [Bifidobacteriaceae bacterium]
MTLLTITSKGQITLNKEIRAALGVRPGDQVEAHIAADGSAVLRPVMPAASIEDVFGVLGPHPGRAVSIEEMNQAIADGWSGRL